MFSLSQSKRLIFLVILFLVFSYIPNQRAAASSHSSRLIFVSPEGSDANSGLSSEYPLKHTRKALKIAHPGDTIILLPGVYREDLKIVKGGLPGRPIRIIGMPGSVIVGNNKPMGKILYIASSYVELVNLNINGHFKDCSSPKCFHDKLVYIQGSPKNYLKGVKLINCRLENAMGECVRIKYSKNLEIKGNSISHCGLRDFYFKLRPEKKNGEGIYLGTAPEQDKGFPDRTSDVLIKNNFIATYGSECIDVKENSSNIKIIGNFCTGELQKTVGGISIRSNNNYIANNVVFGNLGAGIRLGGDRKNDGVMNSVVNNWLDSNSKCALKIVRYPQKKICGNRLVEGKIFCKKKSMQLCGNEAFKPCNCSKN